MSKSAGNFFTVREIADKYGYEPIRYFMLSAGYRMPLNYTVELIESCKSSLERLYTCRDNLDFAIKNAPAEGEDRPRYQPNADVFWSGVQALHARAVVVMGSVAARALGLPAGVRPLQQLRHRGTLVWVLWDVEFLLDEPQRYAAMLAFVRRALQQISRR